MAVYISPRDYSEIKRLIPSVSSENNGIILGAGNPMAM